MMILLFVVVKMIWFWNMLAGICQCYTFYTDLSWCSSLNYSTYMLLIYCLLKLYTIILFYLLTVSCYGYFLLFYHIHVFLYFTVVSMLLTFSYIWFQDNLCIDMYGCTGINATYNVFYQLSSYIFYWIRYI